MKNPRKILRKVLFVFTALLVFANYSVAEAQNQLQNSQKQRIFEQFKQWHAGMGALFEDMGPSSIIGTERMKALEALDQKMFAPLGAASLSYLIAINSVDHFIGGGIYVNSKFEVHNVGPKIEVSTTEEFPDVLEKNIRYDARKMFLKWWFEGQERTPQWFSERYLKWLALRRAGKTAEAKEMYQKLLDIGLPAIPLWLDKLKAKPDANTQRSIIEALAYLTDGAVKPGLPITDYVKWWQTDQEKWTVPFPKSRAAYIEWLQKEAATNDGLGVAYATTISRIEDRGAIAALIGLLRHPAPAVRAMSLEQLQKLVGEALPQPYRLPATEKPWETRSDLVESGQYEAIGKIIGEGRINIAQPESGDAAAQALEEWWRDAKATPIHWERAWASL